MEGGPTGVGGTMGASSVSLLALCELLYPLLSSNLRFLLHLLSVVNMAVGDTGREFLVCGSLI